jgi:hypothetical protein
MASPNTIARRNEIEEMRRSSVRITQSGMITVYKMYEEKVESTGKIVMKRKPYIGLKIADAQHLELFYNDTLTVEEQGELEKGLLPHWWKLQLKPLFAQSCEYILQRIKDRYPPKVDV